MQQTPVYDVANPDLLALMPAQARHVVEVGCSTGALAREFKRINPGCRYDGIDIDPVRAEQASNHCDRIEIADLDAVNDAWFDSFSGADLWVFGDTLEHLKDPWTALRQVRSRLAPGGCVVACVPNAQHWSVQARLCGGIFRYEDSGLLDRTHLRWFTRITLWELFESAGLRIEHAAARIFAESAREHALAGVAAFAAAIGTNVEQATRDASAFQYVVRAVAHD